MGLSVDLKSHFDISEVVFLPPIMIYRKGRSMSLTAIQTKDTLYEYKGLGYTNYH